MLYSILISIGLRTVAMGILAHGVTAFYPTIITSSSSTYARLLPHMIRTKGKGINGFITVYEGVHGG